MSKGFEYEDKLESEYSEPNCVIVLGYKEKFLVSVGSTIHLLNPIFTL